MANKGRTLKPHKNVHNSDRPNGKSWKKHPKKNKIRKSQ